MSSESPHGVPVVADFQICDRLSTRWADVDIYGHVNNTIYYSWVDTVINEWLMTTTGVDTRKQANFFVVAENSCRFRGEMDFPGVVDVGLAIERLGNSSVTYQFGIFAEGDPNARAHGRYVHVNVDAQTRRPQQIPEFLRAAFAQLPVIRPLA